MRRFLPTDAWVRWTLVPMLVFMAMVSDHNYLADFWHHLARGRAMVQIGQPGRSGSIHFHGVRRTVSGRQLA